ncbi:MAG: glutamate--tRNA ligase [Desulfobacterales bacterium]|nr:glutamate--tRNA ligase [Desulfobacterales bacterium]
MDTIITRFPPSPTGFLHIGGARTALFNWLYARHMKGKFVLRIEDTDIERSSQESVDAIFEALEWLGIDWDEGPFFQSQRLALYREYSKKLIDAGQAYYCTCPPESLEQMRKAALEAGENPKYNGTCREKGLGPSGRAVIRLKAPVAGTTVLEDIIKGTIVFQNAELDDFIIVRSDGMPTYNFAVVVDDLTMGINTVIRGDDHVMNTPKQILIYQALESSLPAFGHVPMVLGGDRSRLSKRHGAVSVTAYREMGYLPDAVINYLVRLGWSFGDQEFFTRNELIQKFTLDNIGRSPGIFNPEKLLALNADHIKSAAPEYLARHLPGFLEKKGFIAAQGPFLNQVIETLQTRSKTLLDMADSAVFYYQGIVEYEEKAADKFLTAPYLEALELLAEQFENLNPFDQPNLENAFKTVMEKTGLNFGKIAQPVRVALTGKTASPGIFEIILVLGKSRVIARLRGAALFIMKRES